MNFSGILSIFLVIFAIIQASAGDEVYQEEVVVISNPIYILAPNMTVV
jgi:hypothetical protein